MIARSGKFIAWSALLLVGIVASPHVDHVASFAPVGEASAAWVSLHDTRNPLLDGCRCVPEVGRSYCKGPSPDIKRP